MHCTRKSSQLESRTLASSWRNEAIHINLFGLRIELRFVDKPSQMGIPSSTPPLLRPLPSSTGRLWSLWQRQVLLKIYRIHLCKWSAFYDAERWDEMRPRTLVLMMMRNARQSQDEGEWIGIEPVARTRQDSASNERKLSKLFSSFGTTIKQFTYISKCSSILPTNYANCWLNSNQDGTGCADFVVRFPPNELLCAYILLIGK